MATVAEQVSLHGNTTSSNIVSGGQIMCADQINFGSSTYPNILRREILQTHNALDPDSTYKNMMRDFGGTDYDAFRKEVKSAFGQTCLWSRNNADLKCWLNNKSGLLWLVGQPGAGKTVLAKNLVQWLEEDDSTGRKTIYFFCDRKKKDGCRAVCILRSLIHQCLRRAKDLGAKYVQQEYEWHNSGLLERPYNLGKVFVQMMSDPGPEEWYCIIDALDDCEEGERQALLTCFDDETKPAGANYPPFLRLLIISRPCEEIRAAISKLKNAKIVHFTDSRGKHLNETDISAYIIGNLKTYPTEENSNIDERLIEKAAGNFTYAVSMIHKFGHNPPYRYNDLVAEPASGEESMLRRIFEDAKGESKMLLQLVAVMQRPLLVTELAIMITMKKSPFSNLYALGRDSDTIRQRIQCGEEALKIQPHDEITWFHSLLKDQLYKIWTENELRQVHLKVAEACLIYLISTQKTHSPVPCNKKSDCKPEYAAVVAALPFVEYAASFWPHHFRSAGLEGISELWPYLYDTLENDSSRELSFQVYRFQNHEQYIGSQTFLHILAHHGLEIVAQKILSGQLRPTPSMPVNARDARGRTPLWWAVRQRHRNMVKLLLDLDDVDCNLEDYEHCSPAMLAIEHGLTNIVELFLDTDPTLLTRRMSSKHGAFTSLYWAATSNFADLVTLLLDRNISQGDLDTRCAHQPPLVVAARNGHEAVVKVLLAHGASPNHTDDGDRLTALSWAARCGHEKVIDCLLGSKNIDIYHRDKLTLTAFQWAAIQKENVLARKILSKAWTQRDPLWQDKMPLLLLDIAAKGQEEALDLLLERSTLDLNTEERGSQRTALSLAAEHDRLGIVQKLLSSGKVNVNTADKDGKTPLMWAADRGRLVVVEKLLDDPSLDILATDGDGRRASDWAQATPHPQIYRLIADKEHLMRAIPDRTRSNRARR